MIRQGIALVLFLASLQGTPLLAESPPPSPTPAFTPYSSPLSSSPLSEGPSLLALLKNLGIVAGVATLLIALLKYKSSHSSSTSTASLKVVSRLRLSSKSSLLKVQDGSRTYTLVVGDEQFLLLPPELGFSATLDEAEKFLK